MRASRTIHQDSSTEDRPRYPEIKADHGEDPARFLSCSERYLPLARIRGIRDEGLLSAYRAVELREYGGRDVVLETIESRKEELGTDHDE